MKSVVYSLLFVLWAVGAYGQEAYWQAELPVEDRVADLLGRMTLEEKVGQLVCLQGWTMYDKVGDSIEPSAAFIEGQQSLAVGNYWAVLRADPWTEKTLDNGLNPRLAAEALNALQRWAREETRLGIPLLFAEECAHGHMALGTTAFPTGLCQAATWNAELIGRVGKVAGLEAGVQGASVGYGPILDLARDARWSRVEETYGEDDHLAGVLGTAFVRGMQSASPVEGRRVYSTLKHFAAYGSPRGGHNGGAADVGLRALLEEYVPQFQRAVEEGEAGSIMTSYNSIDGIPCTSNEFLLDSLLRKTWGFGGVVFSDLGSIDGLVGMGVARNLEEAAILALEAGVDIDLGGNAYVHLADAVRNGRVGEARVDSAVARVLRLKFKLGLFENPYVSPDAAERQVHNADHVELARQVAREGVTLLKNEGVLPLSRSVKRVAVIGPNADVAYNYLGDYTAPQADGKVVTLLDAVRSGLPDAEVEYVKGCSVRDTMHTDIASAVAAAERADVVLLAVGGSSARDFKTEYISTGAATVGEVAGELSDMDSGEGFDRATLSLLGDQEELLRSVAATGTPLVTIYIEGRPLLMKEAAQLSGALLTAWYPGEQGGAGIVDVLLGDYNPSGRLPVSIPRGEGQLPVYYSQGRVGDYMDMDGSPLYAFGYGLSYTTFEYDSLRLEQSGDSIVVGVTICNTGSLAGDEVAQLYLSDLESSVVVPRLRLKGFKKVNIPAGESCRVEFVLTEDDLALYNRQLEHVVEPGRFMVSVGSSSDNLPLRAVFTISSQQLTIIDCQASIAGAARYLCQRY